MLEINDTNQNEGEEGETSTQSKVTSQLPINKRDFFTSLIQNESIKQVTLAYLITDSLSH